MILSTVGNDVGAYDHHTGHPFHPSLGLTNLLEYFYREKASQKIRSSKQFGGDLELLRPSICQITSRYKL